MKRKLLFLNVLEMMVNENKCTMSSPIWNHEQGMMGFCFFLGCLTLLNSLNHVVVFTDFLEIREGFACNKSY
jgi:hypothetical protein